MCLRIPSSGACRGVGPEGGSAKFSRFHDAFRSDKTTAEGDIRSAFFLAYDEDNCDYLALDGSLLEAAEDLGCSRTTAFWLITLPLSRPGVIAGCFLVFIPALGEFVIPSLLGGSETLMIGKVLWEEFFSNRDWPVASAVAIILLLILIVPIILFQRNQQISREREG